MGLLKSLLTIGGTAVGSAFGMPQVGAAVGGALGGALSSSKGSSKASKAQIAALQEGRRIAGEARDRAVGYQDPYLNLGRGSVNALSGRLGLPQTGAPAAPANALTSSDPSIYVASPGKMAAAAANPGAPMASMGKKDGGFAGTSPMEPGFMDAVGDTFVDPRTGQAPGQGGPPTDSTGRPMDAQVPMNALTGQPQVDPGTYGTTQNPTAPTPYQRPEKFSGPGAFEFDAKKAMDSPILQAALKRARGEVQSSAAAQGSLFSGNTLKDLDDRALETTYRFLENERDFAAGRHDNERNFAAGRYDNERGFDYGQSRDARSDYQDDRGYLTGRFDRGTDDLFRGVGVGQGAAGVASNAETRYGDQAVGLVTEGGQVKAQNALTQGQIGSDFATGLGGVLSTALAPKNALMLGDTSRTMADAWQFQPQPTNVNFVNTPANLRF